MRPRPFKVGALSGFSFSLFSQIIRLGIPLSGPNDFLGYIYN